MNTVWFEDFLVLCNTRNFSRAADSQHVTQPAFGRRIRALEDWLGVDLFDRSAQPVDLTPAGVWFKEHAQRLLMDLSRLPAAAQEVKNSNASTLKFAATHALSLTFMPQWLRGLKGQFAASPIELVSDVLPRCEALLSAKKVHFAVSHALPNTKAASSLDAAADINIGKDSLVLVTGVGARGKPFFALDGKQTAKVSSEIPYLAYSIESGLGQILTKIGSTVSPDVRLVTIFTAHLASVLRTMAIAGRGVAWLPLSLIADDLSANRLARISQQTKQSIALDIRLIRHPEPLSMTAELLWQTLIKS